MCEKKSKIENRVETLRFVKNTLLVAVMNMLLVKMSGDATV